MEQKEIAEYLWEKWNEYLGDTPTIDYEDQALNNFLKFLIDWPTPHNKK